MRLGDGAGAVLDGEGSGLGDGVGLVVDGERGGFGAVGGVVGHVLGGVGGRLGGLVAVGWSGGGGVLHGGGRGGLLAVRRGGGGRGLLLAARLVVGVGDAELGGVLVLAGGVVDQLDTVALSVLSGLEVVGDIPDVGAVVLGLLDDGVLRNGVAAGALEEDESDGALGGGLPGDGELLAGGDDAVQAGLGDGVALIDVSMDFRASLSRIIERHTLGASPVGLV